MVHLVAQTSALVIQLPTRRVPMIKSIEPQVRVATRAGWTQRVLHISTRNASTNKSWTAASFPIAGATTAAFAPCPTSVRMEHRPRAVVPVDPLCMTSGFPKPGAIVDFPKMSATGSIRLSVHARCPRVRLSCDTCRLRARLLHRSLPFPRRIPTTSSTRRRHLRPRHRRRRTRHHRCRRRRRPSRPPTTINARAPIRNSNLKPC